MSAQSSSSAAGVTTTQPRPTAAPEIQKATHDDVEDEQKRNIMTESYNGSPTAEHQERRPWDWRRNASHWKSTAQEQLLTREAWLGSYDWQAMCMPRLLPYRSWRRRISKVPKAKAAAPFYGLNDPLPIVLAFACGLQHALAMLAGIITPPIIISSTFNLPSATQAYLISASLIGSGLLSALQMSGIPIRIPGVPSAFAYHQLGTGILSVVGQSFATIPAVSAVASALYADGTCPSTTLADGTVQKGACPAGYGYVLGTSAVCGLLEVLLSFMPPAFLHQLFPPIITGPVVFLIGASLIGDSGFANWGGSAGSCESRPATGMYSVCPQVGAPHALPWGSREYLGLGLCSFLLIVLIEIFGSPIMRSSSIVIALILPSLVLGIPLHYTSRESIDSAPAITFLWTTTFPLKVYGPAVLPLLAVYCSLAAEAVGDITASSEVSRLDVSGHRFDMRVKGGVLSDGIGGILSALFTITPMSVFAQNNGVISLTGVANRRAGFCCCFFLLLMGIIGKFSGVILAIPDPILGGVTTFLFASVAVSGLAVLSKVQHTRRNRFILALSLSMGLGNLLVPKWATYFLPTTQNKALAGFYTSVQIIIETPFLISAITGVIANAILPYDDDDEDEARAHKMHDAEEEAYEAGSADDDLGETKGHHLRSDDEEKQMRASAAAIPSSSAS